MKNIILCICIIFILNSCSDNIKSTKVEKINDTINVADNIQVSTTEINKSSQSDKINETKYSYEIQLLSEITRTIESKMQSWFKIQDLLLSSEEYTRKWTIYMIANLDFYKLGGMNLWPNIYIWTNWINYQLMLLIEKNWKQVELIYDTENIITKEKSFFSNISKKLVEKEWVKQYIYEQEKKEMKDKENQLTNNNWWDDLRISDLIKIQTLLNMYFNDYAKYPINLEELNHTLPSDIITWTTINWCTFWYFYELIENSGWFRLSTCLKNDIDNLQAKSDLWIYDNKYEIIWSWF